MPKTIKYILTFQILLYAVLPASSAKMLLEDKNEKIKVFYSDTDHRAWTVAVRGKVISTGVKDLSDDDIKESVQDNTKITVRLNDSFGISPGDELYVINDRNLVIARIKTESVVKSQSYGYLLVGYGNFKRVQEDYLVVQKEEDSVSKYANISKAKGDFYKNNGELSNAIVEYQNAINKNKNYPEAHIEMGYIYLDQKINEYARKEFDEAYKNINYLHDNEEKYRLYIGLVTTRYIAAYDSKNAAKEFSREKTIQEGIKLAEEGVSRFPSSEDLNLILGKFYYINPDVNDGKVKRYMQKTLDINPENVEALTIMAELYYKHKNNEKAYEYAMKAVKIDPSNIKAGDMVNKLEK